jgi:hypothetical protein
MNKYQDALNNLKKVTCNCKLTDLIIATLQELVDKATPKKPIIHYVEMFGTYLVSCPTCSFGLFSDEVIANRMYKARHCANCAQALDWSEENE